MLHTRANRRRAGFTLLELLVTVAVASVLLALGVSGFRELAASTRMTTATNGLIAHLQYARSEAVKRSRPVSLCPSTDGQACLAADPALWQSGYMVAILDASNPPTATVLLRQVGGDGMGGLAINSGGRARFTFQSDGTAGGSAGTIAFCDPSHPDNKRAVVVSNVGRVRVSDYRSGGEAIACP